MKVLVLYRPNSEHGRIVEEFIRDYQRAGHNGTIEALNIDTREGSATASLYDVMEYPSIIVARDDGSILRAWQGSILPLQNEVAAYAYS
ncbi:MAG: hypothetical protein QFB87_05230 [Patescibacteria group bacterium]|nr:hypothetical protein [Patescibacteria group bacterium]